MAEETKTAKGVTHLGYPIVNSCPCGTTVAIDERQELSFDEERNVWVRVCETCINKDMAWNK